MDWRADRIGSAARGENPMVMSPMPSGYAVFGDVQFLPGYSVLLSRDPTARALADLPRRARVQFLADADLLATAVEQACREADPAFRRVNLEILGNTDAFVHAHIWPRYAWEPAALRGKPVWLYAPTNWSAPTAVPAEQLSVLRASIADHLRELLATEGPMPALED